MASQKAKQPQRKFSPEEIKKIAELVEIRDDTKRLIDAAKRCLARPKPEIGFSLTGGVRCDWFLREKFAMPIVALILSKEEETLAGIEKALAPYVNLNSATLEPNGAATATGKADGANATA
jgi:hypothetical protein